MASIDARWRVLENLQLIDLSRATARDGAPRNLRKTFRNA